MKKILIPIIYFGLTSCGNQKAAEPKKSQEKLPNDSTQAVPKKLDYHVSFRANEVSKMGKEINGIFQDIHNNYWFASNAEGVFSYDGKTLIQFTTQDGLCNNQVYTIQEDREANLWFLTAGGINQFNGKTFTTFPILNQPLPGEKEIESETDNLWFELGGGAYHYNGHSFSYLLLPPPISNSTYINSTNPKNPDSRKVNAYTTYCSLKDKDGNLWLGTQTLGVCKYDGKTFTWYTEKGLSGPAVRAIFQDRYGNLWFGNNGNGLFRFDGKKITNLTEENGLGNAAFLKTGKSKSGSLARVWSVNEDNQGNIWIGTYDAGVWRYDGQNFTNYTIKDGLSSNAINTVYKDKQGLLWFGTDGAGVCKFNGISFSTFYH